ncbi:hypothetical protein RD110_15835 [Rhodoferax koreense]|uniref:Uncharacterized protein n=1 Tax=Rhodoferax koreensis TaxID=1842727 RepID=A0A1P8JXK9_9BURK|nr:hypothetical protein [Rhodoferax koreense]APW38492.1 hypothetical protein RD110_15835 [Rhodoferax koreense]
MTTTAFLHLQPKIAQALTRVKLAHCAPPAFRPAADVEGVEPCPRCGSKLVFTVSAATGLSDGRCTAACGVRWAAQ